MCVRAVLRESLTKAANRDVFDVLDKRMCLTCLTAKRDVCDVFDKSGKEGSLVALY